MRNSIKPRKRKGALEKPKQPSKPIRPAHLVRELAINKLPTLICRRGSRKHSDTNNHKPRKRPDERRLVQKRQQARGEGINDKRNNRKGHIDQKLMPGRGRVTLVSQLRNAQDESAAEQTARGCERHPPRDIDPASHVANAAAPASRRDDRRPVVLAPRSRVRAQELGQGRRQA